MLELWIKIDKDGLVLDVHWALLSTNSSPHLGPLRALCAGLKRLSCTHSEGTEPSDSSLPQLRTGKAPGQHASPKPQNWTWWDSQDGRNWERSTEALQGLCVVQPEPKNECRSPKPHTGLDCKTSIPQYLPSISVVFSPLFCPLCSPRSPSKTPFGLRYRSDVASEALHSLKCKIPFFKQHKDFWRFLLNALIVKMCQFKPSFQDIHAKYSRRYLLFD